MNVIELVTKYLPVLDEQYKAESRSAILDMPPEWVVDTKDAKKVKIAKMESDGLGDYSRHSGFAKGYADLTWEEHEFSIDRGRSIQIDSMDNQETFGLAFGRLGGTFQRQSVIPEMDAIRFSKYYKKAGIKKEFTLTSQSVLKLIDDLDQEMDDLEVPEDRRILFVNPSVFKFMINDPSLVKHISVLDSEDKAINKKIYMYDNHMIVKVPSTRFYTDIVLLDGKTAGQEVGGYKKADGADVIGLLMIQADSPCQISKRVISRIWAPTREEAAGTDGVNPDADAWKFDFRVYHDAWVLDNKIAGIAAAVIKGAGLGGVDAEAGQYDSSTGVFTPGNTYTLKKEGTTYVVKGEIPYEDADATLGLDAGNRLTVKFVNSNIASKAALPSGIICRTLKSDGTWQEYTKDAFEDDGSLILVSNVNNIRVGIVEITWVEGTTEIYTLNTLGAELEPAA